MLTVDFSNLYTINNQDKSFGVSEKELAGDLLEFGKYHDLVLSRKQGFIDLPYDMDMVKSIQDFTQSVKGKYKYVVVLGIGGSMLGPKSIIQALGNNSDIEFLFLDNIDPSLISEIESKLDLSVTLFLTQTKSGKTPETIAQYLYFRSKIESVELNPIDHFVFVTDPEKGYLREIAIKEGIKSFEIPENVGGRFSVLTPVGLLTASLAGHDTQKLLLGSKDVLETAIQQSFQLACIQYRLLKKDQVMNVIMPYSSRLKTFAEWTIQLISESLGKEKNLSGEIVNTGITPIPAVGATDQHSQLQLFAEGQNDKLLIFIKVDDYGPEIEIPLSDSSDFGYLNGKTFNNLLDAEFRGVVRSLTERNRANLTVNIEKVDEYYLGQLYMFFELAIAFVGEKLEINTFDQPGVERSKILSKEELLKL